MRTCELCLKDKSVRDFRPRGRGLSKICEACATGVAAEGAAIADELPQPVKLGASIELLPGYGFRAHVESDVLVLEQDGKTADGETSIDNIVLSRTEAKVLFAQFAEWVDPA